MGALNGARSLNGRRDDGLEKLTSTLQPLLDVKTVSSFISTREHSRHCLPNRPSSRKDERQNVKRGNLRDSLFAFALGASRQNYLRRTVHGERRVVGLQRAWR